MFYLICHLSRETHQVCGYCKSVTKTLFKACGEKNWRLTEDLREAYGNFLRD